MTLWTIAGVQFDCKLGDVTANLATVRAQLAAAAEQGAQLVGFPECALSGYCFASRAACLEHAQLVPGPATDAIAADCSRLGVFAVVGMLEKTADGKLFNAAALIGPKGLIACYRKVHIPCVGADRFCDPGDRPFAVHDLGGLRVGLGVCFDLSFPESSRINAILGADLMVLPTNWATQAVKMATLINRVRALENNIYMLCVNRVGDEGGFHFIGTTSIVGCSGDVIATAEHDRPAIVTATIDPAVARQKKIVHCAGEYEIDRLNWRRPEFYGPLLTPVSKAES